MASRLMMLSVALLVVGLICGEVLAQQTSRASSTRSSTSRSTASGSSSTRSLGSGVSAGTRTSIGGTGRASGVGSSGNFGVGSAGTVDSSDRFVRTSRQAGAFVGTDSADTRAFVGSVAAGSGTGTSSTSIRRGGGGGGGGSASANRGGRRGRQSDEIRVTLDVGFALPPGKVAQEARDLAAAKLAGRMERSTWIQKRSPLVVTLDQGIATLRGVVATEHDRVLAEQLALLEPSIAAVKNELTVQPPEPAAPAPAPIPPNPNSLPE
jgi:hypothetical protein